jgi:hypothetical protein
LLTAALSAESMRATLCAITLVVFAFCGFTQTRAAPSTLTILFHFDTTHSEVAFQEVQRELGVLMKPAGLRLAWRNRDDITASESFPELAVVDFRGRCRMETTDLPQDAGGSLARTYVSDGNVLRFSEVDCDQVRAALHSVAGGHTAPQSELILGRAMARILAHELYHVLGHTTSHQSSGLAKRAMSQADLVSDRLAFPPGAINR